MKNFPYPSTSSGQGVEEALMSALQSIEEIAGIGTYEIDLKTNKVYFSPGLYKLFGEDPFSFEPSLDIIDSRSHPADALQVRQIFDRAANDKQPYYYTRRIKHSTGEWRMVESHGKVISDAHGNAIKFFGVVQDITTRKLAEQEIKEQAHFIQSLTNAVPAVIVLTEHPSNEIAFTTRDMMKILGFDADEVQEMGHAGRLNLIHPDDIEGVTTYYSRFNKMRDEEENRVSYRVKNKRGVWVWFDVRGRVFKRDENDKVIQTLHLAFDDSEGKKAEQEILRLKDEIAQKATDKYQSLFNSIDEGFEIVEIIYNEAGEPIDLLYVETNPAFEQQTGLINVAGKLGREVSPNIEAYWLKAYDKVVKTGEPIRVENYNTYTRRWYSSYGSRVGGANDRLVAILFSDITERKHREQEQALLLTLGDSIRPLTDPVTIEGEITSLLREHFDAGWCYYVEWDEANNMGVVRSDATREGLSSLVGKHDVSDVPEYFELIKTKHLVNVVTMKTLNY